MKYSKLILFILVLFSLIGKCQDSVYLMRPTGHFISDVPEMKPIPKSDPNYQEIMRTIDVSFISETIDLYALASYYLYNTGVLTEVNPSYLALTQNEGGFAKVGFYLNIGDEVHDKSGIPYIDIVESRFEGNPGKLMSVTQLFPHEMGHLIYEMLNPVRATYDSRSVDMHYYSVITDYSTAFNEGFAEHIENVSRYFEENDSIRKGIHANIEVARTKSRIAISGFKKDYTLPIRLGYYKMTMPVWYQRYENLKRHDHSVNAISKHPNPTLPGLSINDQITVRNAGIIIDSSAVRNLAQALAMEGVIASFFTQLSLGEAKNYYQDSEFYRMFMKDTNQIIDVPRQMFSPLQNQFMKYFRVLHEEMPDTISTGVETIDFIEGYVRLFPEEELLIKQTFKETTGHKYPDNVPKTLWIMVKNFDHRMLVPDPYGALIVPVYTFDLNAADAIDISTIEGISLEDAKAIVEYRNNNGFFTTLEYLRKIDDLSGPSANLTISAAYDEEFASGLTFPELNFSALIIAPLKQLFSRLLIYFLFIFGLIYVFLLRKEKSNIGILIGKAALYLLQWLFFGVAGLAFVVISHQAWLFTVILTAVFVLFCFLVYRKNLQKRKQSIYSTLLMGLLLLISIL